MGPPKSLTGFAKLSPLFRLHRDRLIVLKIDTLNDDPELHLWVVSCFCDNLETGAVSDLFFSQENSLIFRNPETVYPSHPPTKKFSLDSA